MNATTPTLAIAPTPAAAPVARGFADLDCPCCGAQGGITVHLGSLDEFHCGECDADFDAETVRNLIARWTRVLAWIDLAPVLPAE
jgi:hypothetical protein